MAQLAIEHGGITSLANTLDRSDAQISQWTRGAKLPSGRQRGMRSETARWIENTVGKPVGWLDTDHTTTHIISEPCPAPYTISQDKFGHARTLVQQIINIAERLDDAGLLKLHGYAACLLVDHPAIKAKPRLSA